MGAEERARAAGCCASGWGMGSAVLAGLVGERAGDRARTRFGADGFTLVGLRSNVPADPSHSGARLGGICSIFRWRRISSAIAKVGME